MKARKKSPEADRLRRMAAVMDEFAARNNSIRQNWLGDVESAAHQMIDHESELSSADIADARELTGRCSALREHERVGNTLDARHEAFQIGRTVERLYSRDAFAIARLHTGEYVLDKDRPIKVSPKERRMLDFIKGRTEASMGEFVPAVWSEPYTVANRNKYDQAVHSLNTRMADESVPLRIGIDGLRVVISRH